MLGKKVELERTKVQKEDYSNNNEIAAEKEFMLVYILRLHTFTLLSALNMVQ